MFSIILIQIFTKWYKLATQKLENASQKTCHQKENVGHSNQICLNPLYAMLHMLYNASNIPNTRPIMELGLL
jgi:hypothetical protein